MKRAIPLILIFFLITPLLAMNEYVLIKNQECNTRQYYSYTFKSDMETKGRFYFVIRFKSMVSFNFRASLNGREVYHVGVYGKGYTVAVTTLISKGNNTLKWVIWAKAGLKYNITIVLWTEATLGESKGKGDQVSKEEILSETDRFIIKVLDILFTVATISYLVWVLWNERRRRKARL